ncbi:MAG: Ribonuclease R [Planctomycetes bacterium]|nr:Ribonuclease R [Planctomycetota bacterium]
MATLVVFPRKDGTALGAVLPPDPRRTRPGQVHLTDEEGARFGLPEDQVLLRTDAVPQPSHDETLPVWLRRVRRSLHRDVPWEKIHETLPAESEQTPRDLARLSGAADDAAAAAAMLALCAADPWFRRKGTKWVVVPRETALARAAAARAAHVAAVEDDAFRAWWPKRASVLPPGGMDGAIDAARAFALLGEPTPRSAPEGDDAVLPGDPARGHALMARFDLGEPDLALEALVAAGLLPEDVNPAPHRAGLGLQMPKSARAEAHRIAAEPCDRGAREDLTALFAVSVDDAETTEVDDALSVRRDGDALELLVHISDAADAVPVGGALDRSALARTSTLYVPDGAVTLFPADLVERRMSLDLGRDRAAVTGVFRIAPDGSVLSARFARTMIRVARRLDYQATRDPSSLAASADDAAALVAVAAALRDARRRAGALVAGMPSLAVWAEDGAPRVEPRHQDTPGDLVVAEAAVLYNAQAGRALAAADAAAFFRTQAPPKPEPREDDPLRPLLLRKRFAPTHLSTAPARHHGVGADAYAQATSPMRRVADLVNQRQLLAVATGAPRPYDHATLERMGETVSERERAVRRASADREDHWIARWLLPRLGEEVDTILSRAPRRSREGGGMGSVWFEPLLRELPFRAPEGWLAPPEGSPLRCRIHRIQPWRSRIELAPLSTSR